MLKKVAIVTALFLFILSHSYSNKKGYEALYNEHEVKAVMLWKISMFVEWPKEKIEKEKDFNICFVGDENRYKIFKKILEELTILKKKIKFLRCNNTSILKEAKRSFILFLTNNQLIEMIKELSLNFPILIVGDNDSLIEYGAHICFYLHEDRIRFKLNYKGLKDSMVKVSYKLYNIGEVVNK